jgi:enterobacteria phage integrase
MAARPRDRRRHDWPAGLREPRPGYFTWRNPDTGKDMPIGRVTLAQAKHEAREANDYLQAQKPSLVERLTGAANTMAQLVAQMPEAPAPNTAKSWRSLDKKITAKLGKLPCHALTVRHCAELIEGERSAGRARTAQALRSRLVSICARGMELGWLDMNPAEPTAAPRVETKRERLTLEQFKAILEQAPKVNEWLRGAMLLALVSGQDRSTIAGLRRSAVGPEFLAVLRGKTKVRIEIPLALRLDAIGLSLSDALAACQSGLRSLKPDRDYIVHHARPHGNAPVGAKVHPDNLSHSFSAARVLAGLEGANPPTFHEIRSLAKRLYLDQGGVDTRALLGHLTERMSDLYANPRGAEAIRVKLG